jgi:hypothetical protein
MANKPTTVTDARPVSGKTSNPTKIVFPLDDTGFTTLVRKEGVRAVGRINGSAEKLEVFLATVRVLAQHATAKIASQRTAKEVQAAQEAVIKQEAVIRAARDQAMEVQRLEALVISTQAEIAAKKTS